MQKFSFLTVLLSSFLFLNTAWAVSPAISSVTTTDPATYDNGDTISFNVIFDQVVNVAGGTPDLKFRSPDNLSKSATYVSGTGTNTLVFNYTVGTAPDLNLNDWDGIELEDSSGNPANLVLNSATIKNTGGEDANISVPVTNFVGIKIDSKAPTWNKIEISSVAGKVAGSTRYLPDNSKVTTKSYLTEYDTRSAVSLGLSVGGGADQTIFYSGSNVNGRDKDAQKSGNLTGDGAVALGSYNWTDQAGKVATGVPNFIINDSDSAVNSYVLDSTSPVLSFTDDIDFGPVVTDDFNLSVTETNSDTTTYQYGFSADAVCDATDNFTLPFAAGTAITINDDLSNGKWVCAKAEDLAGNIAYLSSANPLNIDATAPDFAGISVVSNNSYDANYGKADSTLTFTLTLTNADSYDGNGSITFTIGGNSYTTNFVQPASGNSQSTYTATFDLSTISAINNANISITSVNFADFLGQTLTNFVAGVPAPTVIIDTQKPVLSSVLASTNGNNGIWAKKNEVATFTLTFDEEIIRETLNSATTANNVSSLSKEFNLSAWATSDTVQFTVQNGDNGMIDFNNVDFSVVDHAGNSAKLSAADLNPLLSPVITTDTTKPSATGIKISSNNALDTSLAKTNDTIKVEFATADNLATDIVLTNINPRWNYILNKGFTNYLVSGIGAGKFVERFTDGTENSEIEVPFRFAIKDEAGNRKAYTEADLTGSNVEFDRTNPIVQEVKISATSADGTAYLGDKPNYYAKQGDTLDFELQVCDYVDSGNNPPAGTFFGQSVTLTNSGQTGVVCTTPEGNPSVWRKWTLNLAGIDGSEGLIGFNIQIKDNAGNVFISVTGTTDGSSVIFDKTIPINPTDVVDSLGAETLSFKHRSKAQFSWTNDVDDTANSAIVSGIQDYNVRLANIDGDHRKERVNSRNFDGRNSNLTGKEIPPHDITDPYKFYLQTRDKAGNESAEKLVYTQPYTIGFVGKVIDKNGNPVEGATVQVVSRYGETCDKSREVCTDTTDANGEYIVLAQKDQDYNLTFFHQRYYLDKQEKSLGNTDDEIVNSILNNINSVHEVQRANQGVEITLSQKFVREDGKEVATKVFVYSWSGEISTTSEDENLLISSLSRINLINSNNPDLVILSLGENKYKVLNSGRVLSTTSITGQAEENSREKITSFGISSNYSSGSSRIGTKYIPSNGNPKNTFGKYTTPAEWKAYSDRLRYGVKPQILTYINRNGYEVFAGYKSGILGWENYPNHYENKIKLRRTRQDGLVFNLEKEVEVISLAEKIYKVKSEVQTEKTDKELQFLESLEALKPLSKRTPSDAYRGILLRNKQREKINKWERKSPFGEKFSSDPYTKRVKKIRIKFANGESAKIERVVK